MVAALLQPQRGLRVTGDHVAPVQHLVALGGNQQLGRGCGQVRDVQGLDPVALVGADCVLITADAVKKVEEWLA